MVSVGQRFAESFHGWFWLGSLIERYSQIVARVDTENEEAEG